LSEMAPLCNKHVHARSAHPHGKLWPASALQREAVSKLQQMQSHYSNLAPEANGDAEEARLAAMTETLQELQLDLSKAKVRPGGE